MTPANPLEALLAASGETAAFPPNSRYHGLERAVWRGEDRRTALYIRRRFVPSPERFSTQSVHGVSDGERLDHVAARRLGDPELFWRICDANGAMKPWELTETPGRTLRIPLPLGVPGVPGVPGSGG